MTSILHKSIRLITSTWLYFINDAYPISGFMPRGHVTVFHLSSVGSERRWKPYSIRTFFIHGCPRSWWHAANVHGHRDGIDHQLVMPPHARTTPQKTWRLRKNRSLLFSSPHLFSLSLFSSSLKWFIRCYQNTLREKQWKIELWRRCCFIYRIRRETVQLEQ